MAKRVFFSFHYQDVIDFRANVVRNHWVTKPDRESAGFFDASVWESAKKTSDLAVKRLINQGINGTSRTAILIGSQTYLRRWVRYEIVKSFAENNKIIGIHINGIADKFSNTKRNGPNPLEYMAIQVDNNGKKIDFLEYSNLSWSLYQDHQSISLGNALEESLRGRFILFSEFCPVYDWVSDDGYNNFASWIDLAS